MLYFPPDEDVYYDYSGDRTIEDLQKWIDGGWAHAPNYDTVTREPKNMQAFL